MWEEISIIISKNVCVWCILSVNFIFLFHLVQKPSIGGTIVRALLFISCSDFCFVNRVCFGFGNWRKRKNLDRVIGSVGVQKRCTNL